MLASYLIDPERHTHKLDEISKSELGYEMVSYDSVTKVGKKQSQARPKKDFKIEEGWTVADASFELE